ncbi:MAG TPA: hypothetical protein VGF14_04020 [Alphaproteobacteria bacterium]
MSVREFFNDNPTVKVAKNLMLASLFAFSVREMGKLITGDRPPASEQQEVWKKQQKAAALKFSLENR